MTIIAWALYACLTQGASGIHCHEHGMAQMTRISDKKSCMQAAQIIETEADWWEAYCLPVMREK